MEVEAHLNMCTLCREEYNSMLKLWAKLAEIPEEKPGEQVRVRFYAMLEAYREGLAWAESRSGFARSLDRFVEAFWPRRVATQFALTLALLVVSFLAGIQLAATPAPSQDDVALLRDEVRMMGRMLTISLLQQQSASERLKGVSWSYQIEQPDQQVVSALLRALRYDTNVNVRLAAVDALAKFIDDPLVVSEIVNAIPQQSSPLVQLALVNLMIDERVRQSADVLKRLSADPKVDPTVKNRIQEGMKQFSL
jgi:hypothetical protein